MPHLNPASERDLLGISRQREDRRHSFVEKDESALITSANCAAALQTNNADVGPKTAEHAEEVAEERRIGFSLRPLRNLCGLCG